MGAIAVLFLFVVIIIDLKEVERNDGTTGSLSLISMLFFIPSLLYTFNHISDKGFESSTLINVTEVASIELMGQLLYTKLWEFYLIAGFVLLVALIGAIVLTVPRPYSLIATKEDVSRQLARNPSDAIFTVVKSK